MLRFNVDDLSSPRVGAGPCVTLFLACVLALLSLTSASATPVAGPLTTDSTTVVFETTLGDIIVAFDTDRAPATTEYFLGYVDRGQYDHATLYRVASLDDNTEPQIVQGGVMVEALNQSGTIDPSVFGVNYLHTLETTDETGIRHRRGVVSFARDLLYTGHVIPEIVFCLRDVPAMDAFGRDKPDSRGFPAAGYVISGMEVIESLISQPREGATEIPFLKGQILSKPVRITHAYRLQKKT